MNLLEVEPLDLGADVRAVRLELVEPDENREPVRGAEAARVWGRVLAALAGTEPWALDFFSHLDRVRDYCAHHHISWCEPAGRAIVVTPPEPETLAALFARFEGETFGARAGGTLAAGDAALENELARRGVDAYQPAFPNYFFCAVCDFEEGSLVVLSTRLWASEVIRRVRPVASDLCVEVRLPV
jgi:hypothetical protein